MINDSGEESYLEKRTRFFIDSRFEHEPKYEETEAKLKAELLDFRNKEAYWRNFVSESRSRVDKLTVELAHAKYAEMGAMEQWGPAKADLDRVESEVAEFERGRHENAGDNTNGCRGNVSPE